MDTDEFMRDLMNITVLNFKACRTKAPCTIKDVAPADVWGYLPPGLRKRFGIFFSKHVHQGKIPIIYCGKNSANAKLYKYRNCSLISSN
ncbi:single-stranded DNA-binding protein [Aestuariicella sp. G3-2]|uniref:single-stranded DNA-binding protein n=1 Tax=Pseudomaricurvus albidus TaxID=2842452 RepID=UPI001C0E341F|nr:single-stranded DNA-binding protein [Aestuariicella albida]MBU3069391.1 single-stranded DNA-binding protein [Aestuariicella albida]